MWTVIRAAVVVYRHGAHIINIFAWAAGTEKIAAEETQKGYHIACWRSADLDFCAVPDTAWTSFWILFAL